MILISGSSEREIVDLQQGDYEEMDQLAIAKPLCKAAFRRAARCRYRHRASRARDPRRGCRAVRAAFYLDLPAKLFRPGDGCREGQEGRW